jgi:hypothetical protein
MKRHCVRHISRVHFNARKIESTSAKANRQADSSPARSLFPFLAQKKAIYRRWMAALPFPLPMDYVAASSTGMDGLAPLLSYNPAAAGVAHGLFVAPRPNAASGISAQAVAAVARKAGKKRTPSVAPVAAVGQKKHKVSIVKKSNATAATDTVAVATYF